MHSGRGADLHRLAQVGETHGFGSAPAGSDLTFELFDYVFGTQEGSVSSTDLPDTIVDSPDEWTIQWEDGTINVYAINVADKSTLGTKNPLQKDPQCQTANPVNCATGNFTHTLTDDAIPGRGLPLDLTRTYNSLSASTEGTFGYGWASSYSTNLTFDAAGDATVTGPQGAQNIFYAQGSGVFAAAPQVLGTLVQNSDGTYTLTEPGQDVETFSSTGQLTSETDPNGYSTTLAYNDSGQLSTVTDPEGRTLTYAYGTNGLVSSVTDPAGRVVSYGYDSAGNLTSATSVDGGIWSFGYDANHLLTSMTDPRIDGSLTNTYDSSARVTEQVDPMGHTTTFSYGTPSSDDVQTNTITSPDGHVETEQYTDGELTSLTKGSGTSDAATWTYSYGITLGVTSTTDPNGNTTSAAYDANGNETSSTNADGDTTTSQYNAFDEPTSITDPAGNTTTDSYDASGNLQSVSRTLTSTGQTQTTSYAYGDPDHPGDVTAITDPDGNQTTMTYDVDGDLAASTNPSGDKTTYDYSCTGTAADGCYSDVGLLYSEVSPRGNATGALAANFTTTWTYNALGQPKTETDPLGHETTYSYDLDGNQTGQTDPAGNATTYAFNADNQPTTTTRADQTTLVDAYNADGDLHSQTNGAGKTTIYHYNALDEMTSSTDPLGHETTYAYDGDGNVTTVTDPAGRTTTNGYDAANLLKTITYSDDSTPNVSYDYNSDGQVTSMTDGTGTTTYSYDSLDRLTGQTNGDGQAVTYGYDLAGNQTSIGYPNGNTVTDGYTDGQLSSVTDWLGHETTFAYDPDSDLQTETFPSATSDVDTYGYDDADQLTSIDMDQSGSALATLTDTYNNDGELSNETQTGLPGPASVGYTYNSLSQITAAGNDSYDYNAADNPTKLDSATGYSYNDAGELTGGPSDSYTYNTLDQRTAATPSTGTGESYAYDQAGRLITYTPPAGAATSYVYDGNGLRASKTTGSTIDHFAYNLTAATPLVLTNGHHSYIYGPGNLSIEQIGSGGTVTYLHHDQLGSTRLITDASGHSAGAVSYSLYGKPTSTSGTASNNLGYAGQYTDSETGFQYDDARYYDPATAQFITPDPLQSLTGEPYVYANDQPANETDPSGDCFGCTVGNFIAGGFNTSTFGASNDVLHALGINPDQCSAAYEAGEVIGPFVLAASGDEFAVLGEVDDVGGAVASSTSDEILPYSEARQVGADENIDDLYNELKSRTWESGGNEHALIQYPNGDRAIGSGGPGGISDVPGEVLAHTHPTSAPPSATDFAAAAQQLNGMDVLHGGLVTHLPGYGG